MAWTSPSTAVAGTVLTAAWLNTYLRDNMNALRAGGIAIASQAALDFIYASSASQLARVAAGTAYQVPRINSAGTGWEFAAGSERTDVWTPVIGGSGGTSGQTYGVSQGIWSKNGTLVVAGFNAVLSAKGTITGNVQIQGLPFTSMSVGNDHWVSSLQYIILNTNWVQITARVPSSTTVAGVYGAAAAGTSNMTALTTTDITNTTQFIGTIIYRASS